MNKVTKKLKGGVVLFRLIYMERFKDPVVALVCSQLHYWYTPRQDGKAKALHKVGQHWWLIKPYDEWKTETLLSLMQVRRALAVLEKAGVIVTMNRSHNGKILNHIRAVVVLGDKLLPEESTLLPVAGSVLPVTSAGATGNTPYIGEIKEEISKDWSLSLPATEQDSTMPGKKNSALEILAQFQSKKEGATTSDKLTSAGFYETWRVLVPKHTDVQFVKPFTMAELGMAGKMFKLWGSDAQKILALVIKDWIAFTKYAEANAGAFKSPLQPTVPYLLKFSGVAANFYLVEQASKPVQLIAPVKKIDAPKPPGVPPTLPVDKTSEPDTLIPSPVVNDDEAPASMDEILAAEEWLKGQNKTT